MIIIDYKKSRHKQILRACILALKQGKILAYPTDTSYGLAVDAENFDAVKKLYRIKGREFNKPIHVIVPNEAYAKKLVNWNSLASRLAKKFWPGAITLVLGLRIKGEGYRLLSAGNGTIGLRMPKNQIALDLAKYLKRSITATSANISGAPDIYSAGNIAKQFNKRKFQPDIIINAGKLPKRKPSTVVKIEYDGKLRVLRSGSVKVGHLEP
jgi:L-threonylcarbamoyladenylate synthase